MAKLTEAECKEIERRIIFLDPKRRRIFIDASEDGWMIVFPLGVLHPKTFLDLTEDMVNGK